MRAEIEQMMKCDMCFDRTSAGKRPMCATVCPSQALAFVPRAQIERERQERPANVFVFGRQTVTTKVSMMVPITQDHIELDVVDFMWEAQA